MAKRDLTREHLKVTDETGLTWTVPRGSELHAHLIPLVTAGYLQPPLPREVILNPERRDQWLVLKDKRVEQLNEKLKKLTAAARSGKNVEYLTRALREAETLRVLTLLFR